MVKHMNRTLFSVIKNNIECAFCKEVNCPLRYHSKHEVRGPDGTRSSCKKEYEKRIKHMN